jgi:hypothetical protein
MLLARLEQAEREIHGLKLNNNNNVSQDSLNEQERWLTSDTPRRNVLKHAAMGGQSRHQHNGTGSETETETDRVISDEVLACQGAPR